MATDLYILITKSELTTTLSNLSNSRVDMVALRIPSANMIAANTELATLGVNHWISNEGVELLSGQIIDSLVLPKKGLQ